MCEHQCRSHLTRPSRLATSQRQGSCLPARALTSAAMITYPLWTSWGSALDRRRHLLRQVMERRRRPRRRCSFPIQEELRRRRDRLRREGAAPDQAR